MAPVKFKTVQALLKEYPNLKYIIGSTQLKVVVDALRGEERQWFESRMIYFNTLFKSMPHTYEQDGLGKDAIAHLHYFNPSVDHFITEKDITDTQHQAFGVTRSNGFIEQGYISINMLIKHGFELDFHFHPIRIGDL